MELRVGTSGYSYKEWKGIFYPERLPAKQMLAFYAQQLGAVEINQTFYRLPKREVLESWVAQVPPEFRFAVKAPRRITHFKRLRAAQDETAYLIETLQALGPRFGTLLVQLPPDFARSDERLAEFLELLPAGLSAAFEFRHASWDDPAVRERLGARGIAVVGSDAEGDPELQAGTRAGYLRLRRETYTADELAAWARRIRAQPWQQAFVFFKHEQEGPARALALARAFAELDR